MAAGASLYLTPAAGTYVIGSKFSVAVKVNSGGEVINAAEGIISFDNKTIEVVSLSRSGAIFNLWTTEPTFSNAAGTISFGGGIPRPGYKGSAGQVCTITFRAKKADTAFVRFTSGAVLANDGKGTNILSSMGSGSYIISPEVTSPKVTGEEEAGGEKIEPDYNKPNIISPTHPDQNTWYSTSTVKLRWDLPESVNGISFIFDQEPWTDPTTKSDSLLTEKEYKDVADGVWYFHLKFKDSKRWGTIAHYRVMIDTKPPQPFQVEVKQIAPGDWPELRFKAIDDGSGILKYEVIVGSLEAQAIELKPEDTLYKPVGLSTGEHTVLIKAIDKAGNERVETVSFNVEPIEAPVIKSYAAEIKSSDRFYMSGTAVANTQVVAYLERENNIVATGTITSDTAGGWFYIHPQGLPNNRYVAWVEAINDKGITSKPSNKVSFLVSPPIFARLGSFVINYFTVFVSLLFMIILIIIAIMYIANLLRRRLKKETIEVEQVLHKNFANLNEIINEEFSELNKIAGTSSYNKERIKLKQRLVDHVDEAERKILKEIKDVEDILK